MQPANGPDISRTEYIYGRVRLLDRIAGRFLKKDDGSIFQSADDESSEATLYAYCNSREEAAEFARDVLVLGHELTALGEDLRRFVKEYVSERWEDEDAAR